MMGGETPKTCWAVNKRQDNKLENCCIWLVIYLNCTMMHGITNLKPIWTFLFSSDNPRNKRNNFSYSHLVHISLRGVVIDTSASCSASQTFRVPSKISFSPSSVESSWNVMAHGDAREGKWRGNWQVEWVVSTLHTTSEHGVSSIATITTADAHTSAANSRLNWRPRRFKWNRPFRRKRRNLVSARVPSHFKRSLPPDECCTYLKTRRDVFLPCSCISMRFL